MEVATKLYEALQDFTLEGVNPENGEATGAIAYTKGERYSFPPEVAATAPEGALQEVVETPPTPTTPPAETVATSPGAEKPSKPGFVGGHTMADN